jgi:hypothetical protein
MTRHDFARNLWRWSVGLPELEWWELMKESEWSPAFERLMRNRLLVGAFRYGRIGATDKPKYDRLEAIIRRAERYHDTGNDDLLVDIANLSLLEFVEGTHPNRHMSSEEHVESVRVK